MESKTATTRKQSVGERGLQDTVRGRGCTGYEGGEREMLLADCQGGVRSPPPGVEASALLLLDCVATTLASSSS